jgi:D-alanyl-D-alanine dipeptidase
LPWIAIYIKAIYNYALGIIGILAALTLMIGGVIYLTSAGNATRISEAKSWITGSLTGMLIMFTSYVLLNEINPDLIGFKPVKLSIVQEMTESDNQANIDAGAAANPSFTPANVRENRKVQDASQCSSMVECDNSGAGFIDAKTISEITNNIVIPSNVDARLLPATIAALKKASKAAATKGVKLRINDGLRSQRQQCNYWFKYGKDPARVSRPGSCNSHMGGTTVDMAINGANMGADRHARNANTKLLYDIMVGAGFVRYCGEYWHFQFNDSQSLACPGKGGHCTIYKDGKIQQAPGCTN